MKFTNTQGFTKHIHETCPGHFSRVYLLIGKEDFERKEMEKTLINQLIGKNNSREHVLHLFDGESARIDSVLDELFTKSFFASHRVICIQNGEKLDKVAMNKLEDYFENPSPTSFLVISATAINRATKFYKKGGKAGIILDLEEEKPWEKENSLINKVTEWAQQENKKLDAQTARYFIQHAGIEQSNLYSEMEKLLCYTAEKNNITKEDIFAICTKVHTENGWQLGDAIFRRDGASALNTATSLLQEGTAFFLLMRQIRSQFQTKLQICSILEEGGYSDEIQQKYPYMKGQILQQNIQQAKNYGKLALQKGILWIDEAELQAKSSATDPALITQRLIIKLIG